MYFNKIPTYLLVIFFCASCNYISEVASGGGQDDSDRSKEDETISLADINEVLAAIKIPEPENPDEITNLETAGSLQGAAHASAASNIVAQINARPKILNIVDDWGQTCPMQNSEYCGGYGVALVPAHDENITGLACGSGTEVDGMVVNYEWVKC